MKTCRACGAQLKAPPYYISAEKLARRMFCGRACQMEQARRPRLERVNGNGHKPEEPVPTSPYRIPSWHWLEARCPRCGGGWRRVDEPPGVACLICPEHRIVVSELTAMMQRRWLAER